MGTEIPQSRFTAYEQEQKGFVLNSLQDEVIISGVLARPAYSFVIKPGYFKVKDLFTRSSQATETAAPAVSKLFKLARGAASYGSKAKTLGAKFLKGGGLEILTAAYVIDKNTFRVGEKLGLLTPPEQEVSNMSIGSSSEDKEKKVVLVQKAHKDKDNDHIALEIYDFSQDGKVIIKQSQRLPKETDPGKINPQMQKLYLQAAESSNPKTLDSNQFLDTLIGQIPSLAGEEKQATILLAKALIHTQGETLDSRKLLALRLALDKNKDLINTLDYLIKEKLPDALSTLNPTNTEETEEENPLRGQVKALYNALLLKEDRRADQNQELAILHFLMTKSDEEIKGFLADNGKTLPDEFNISALDDEIVISNKNQVAQNISQQIGLRKRK